MSIDVLLDREHDRDSYNCLHYAGDCWLYLTGDERLSRVREHGLSRQGLVGLFRGMKRSRRPTEDPSIALMDTMDGQLHIGVCWRRRLLHINEAGCQFLRIEALEAMYKNMRFYS